EPLSQETGDVALEERRWRRTLRDGSGEQAPRRRQAQEDSDALAARRLAGHGDPGGIAAERANVLPHPLQRQQLVEYPDVDALGEAAVAELLEHHDPAQHTEAIVHGDDDAVPRLGEVAPSERRL